MQTHYNLCKFYTCVFLLSCCHAVNVYAVDGLTLKVANIKADDWSLKDAVLSLNHLDQTPPQFSLQSATLVLPPPAPNITELDIRCQQFQWSEKEIICAQGQARFNAEFIDAGAFYFSFRLNDETTTIEIKQLSLLGGVVTVHAKKIAENWKIQVNALGINLAELKALLSLEPVAISDGTVDIKLDLSVEQGMVQHLSGVAVVKNLSLQDPQGTLATEAVTVNIAIDATRQQTDLQWQSHISFISGGLYVEPVFLALDVNQVILLSVQGVWNPEQKIIKIDQLLLQHPDILTIKGNAQLTHQTEIGVETANFRVQVPQLKAAAPLYLLPYLESGAFAGIEVSGTAEAQFSIKQNAVDKIRLDLNNLSLNDVAKRFSVDHANAQINWAKQQENTRVSVINWQQLTLQSIPIQAGRIEFSSYNKQLTLLKQTDLTVLDGVLSLKSFSFSAADNRADTSVHFEGEIARLSLEQLTHALNWPPLTGTISGHIPSVHYRDKTLSLDGELKIQVFDGEVTIKKLASSGMFTNFSQFYMDIEFDHLDLEAITQKFDVGYIEGRLSGQIQNLYMENWQAVSFYAWIGTPDEDDSTHKISQKAVENIASIGGGGISDVLSRGFLGLFSRFGYNKLGFGCYLHQGVCQLMGVEATDNGFYLIKGGGLPRINVIGYNPRLDWDILLNRLSRIKTTDEVIVK